MATWQVSPTATRNGVDCCAYDIVYRIHNEIETFGNQDCS